MPKKVKSRKNTKNVAEVRKYELHLKTEGLEYAKIIKINGGGRYECECYDNKTRLCIMRRKIKKYSLKMIMLDSIVLISLRDFQDDKADILHVYTPEDTCKLVDLFEIPAMKSSGHIKFDIDEVVDDEEEKEVDVSFEDI